MPSGPGSTYNGAVTTAPLPPGPDALATLEVAPPVATITMSRPERRNALSRAHMETLIAHLRAVEARDDVAVVLVRGRGPAFCSGHDLAELRGLDDAGRRALFDCCVELMETVQSLPQPVIAVVHGVATAAGCQLVATCDLAVASTAATFATPGVRIGLFCSTPMVALSRAVGRKRALEMLLTGDALDAETACAAGLVNRVVSPERLDAEVDALVQRIAAASPRVVAGGKAAFYRQVEQPQADAYRLTAALMTAGAGSADAGEGIGAFLERRPPVWRSGPA